MQQDTSPRVLKNVVNGLQQIGTLHPSLLGPKMIPAVQLCLSLLENCPSTEAHDMVVIEVCDFFVGILEMAIDKSEVPSLILPVLPALMPRLLSRMKYGLEELQQQRDDAAAFALGAKEIVFSRSDMDDAAFHVTVRRAASRSFDSFASELRDESAVLESALPAIQEALNSHDIWVQESGLLAIGALGCSKQLYDYLPSLFPIFIQCLTHEVAEIKSISCWVSSR